MAGRIDLNALGKKLRQFKYPALILLLGLALILWPARTRDQAPALPPAAATEPSLEERMETLLSQIEGAGEVRVLLTKRTGDEILYQTDDNVSSSADTESSSRATVMARSAGGTDVPVQRQTVYGEYRGALVLCAGADSPRVQLALVNAVAGLTGLSTDRITVIKMKQWEEAE